MTEYSDRPLVVVTLGRVEDAARWQAMPRVSKVITWVRAAPSGARMGKRFLGLGVDSVAVAVKTLVERDHVTYLATNPWIAVALKALGRSRLIVTGIYATPHSRQWRFLRRVLRDAVMITWTEVEAASWRGEGGRAIALTYGNTFPYEALVDGIRKPNDAIRIFIGGASDRDHALIDRLVDEVLSSSTPLQLNIAVGGNNRTYRSSKSVVRFHAQLTQKEFGRMMSSSNIVFLPLIDNDRAAGHMLTVGALQVGVRVVSTPNKGMSEYVDGYFVSQISQGGEILPYLLAKVDEGVSREVVHQYWYTNFSRDAMLGRLGNVLATLIDSNNAKYSD